MAIQRWDPVRDLVEMQQKINRLFEKTFSRSAGAEGVDSVVQVIAVSPDFHDNGQVLAGTEDAGLWRSTDGGRTFELVADAPERVDALTSTSDGWLLSDDQNLWRSSDGLSWEMIPDSGPALILLDTPDGIWAGGENGVTQLN